MNDEQRLLASAALDGALTTEERARADTDPDVVAEIDRLGRVRAALRADTAPDADRRAAAIAAAIAAFDVGRSAATAPPPPARSARRHRQGWLAPVAAAAAVAVIGVGAIVVVQSNGGSDDDGATSATESPDVAAGTGADAEGGGDEVATADADRALSAEAPAATTGAAAPTTTSPAAADMTGESDDGSAVLRTPDDLAAFAQRPVAQQLIDESACAGGDFVGSAPFEVDGVIVDVDVFVEDTDAVALDPITCQEIARAPLP